MYSSILHDWSVLHGVTTPRGKSTVMGLEYISTRWMCKRKVFQNYLK